MGQSFKRLIRQITPPVIFDLAQYLRDIARGDHVGQTVLLSAPDKADHVDFNEVNYIAGDKVFNLPLSNLRHHGGQCFSYEQHHFLRYYRDGIDGLAEYYERHQPASIYEKHFIFNQLGDAPGLPWLVKTDSEYYGEHGLDENHGHSAFGPVSEAKLKLESQRLDSCYKSIKSKGYVLSSRFPRISNGYPRGYFLLKSNGCWVFVVVGAKHRVAALAALGWKYIPVSCEPGYPRCIHESQSGSWPGVLREYYTRCQAKALFDTYFRNREVSLW